MINVGIYGATGYAGHELVQILARHPQVQIAFATSETYAGQRLNRLYPAAPPLELISAAAADPAGLDCVMLCLPHAASAPTAIKALESGARVVDLSADFRLHDVAVYEQWYKTTHPAPELLSEAVYGLTEFVRPALPQARLVANPGCYPTGVLLALHPALCAGAIVPGATLIADSKSGASGAGRKLRPHLQFVELAGNFSAYSIGRRHRHLPEMEQVLRQWAPAAAPKLLFSPHLLPVPRGILSTIYLPLAAGWDEARLRELYAETYAGEPFVQLLPPGEPLSLAHAVHTNLCVLGLTVAADTLIMTSVIDNLVKGASGQAVQNMNVMFGLDETMALI